MSDLRSKVIRLAHEKPELRKHLLPLINGEVKKQSSLVWDWTYHKGFTLERGRSEEEKEIFDSTWRDPDHIIYDANKEQAKELSKQYPDLIIAIRVTYSRIYIWSWGSNSQSQLAQLKSQKNASARNSVSVALSFSPMDLAEKSMEIEKIIQKHIARSSGYNYFVNTSVGDVPVLYIQSVNGQPMDASTFRTDWKDAMRALVQSNYLKTVNLKKGLSMALRSKALVASS